MDKDTIYRQSAIDAVAKFLSVREGGNATWWKPVAESVIDVLPSAQPERLTDDDFETIRIHLSAHKEKLCNQNRWKEAEEYQRIIDRFMSFASAQPDVPDTNVGDTISRQAAIEAHCELCPDNGKCNCDICPDVEVFRLIPDAQPEQKTGQWTLEIHDRLMDETGGKAVHKNEHWGRGENNDE